MTDILELGKKHGATIKLSRRPPGSDDCLMFTPDELRAFADELTRIVLNQVNEWMITATKGALHLGDAKKGADTLDGALAAMKVDIENSLNRPAGDKEEPEYDALSMKQLRDALHACFEEWSDFDLGINLDNIEKNYTYFSVTVVHKSMGHEYTFDARVDSYGKVLVKLYNDSDWRAIDKATMFSWMWFETAEPRK